VRARQRGWASAPEFARALETERQGVAMYAQTSFTEAAAGFRAATELFAKALPPPEPPKAPAVAATPSVPVAPSAPAAPGAPNPRAAIVTVLDAYGRSRDARNRDV